MSMNTEATSTRTRVIAYTEVYAVIDVGCYECGVDSEPVGLFLSRQAANNAAKRRDAETKHWRDGGQTYCVVLKMAMPTTPD